MSYRPITKGTPVYSRDGKLRGETTGAFRRCTLEGCGGERVYIRWPDGRLTYPCSKGLGPFRGGTDGLRIQ